MLPEPHPLGRRRRAPLCAWLVPVPATQHREDGRDCLGQPVPETALYAERVDLGSRQRAPATDRRCQRAFRHASALLIDESAFAKKGDLSAGVARQWNGRLGKIDNSQVGVFAAMVRDRVAALVEGELYVPEECFADPQRGREAGIPEEMEFRTKGEIALSMIHRLRREGLRRLYRVRCRLRPSAVAVARPGG